MTMRAVRRTAPGEPQGDDLVPVVLLVGPLATVELAVDRDARARRSSSPTMQAELCLLAGQRECYPALLRPASADGAAVERSPAVSTLVIGEPTEDARLNGTAPATLGHRGGVAGAES
jgi:hypothetical protein